LDDDDHHAARSRVVRGRLNDYRHPRFIATVPGQGYRFILTFTNLGWGGAPIGEKPPRH
jgi:DNA-binding winged helix-turn-helix (wHTH) protein